MIGRPCINHRPVQHRDGKPPWCKECGLTKDYQTPLSRLRSELPPPETTQLLGEDGNTIVLPTKDLSFLKYEERRRLLCLDMALESFYNEGEESPSNHEIVERARIFERFAERGI